MRQTLLPLGLLAALALVPAPARAEVHVDLHLDLPLLMPGLVVVQPGLQVVPDVDAEIFFVDDWYWTRHGHGWVRARSPRGGWVMVPASGVPGRLKGLPPGKYRKWHPAPRPRPVLLSPPIRRVETPPAHQDHGRHEGHGKEKDDRGKGKDKGKK